MDTNYNNENPNPYNPPKPPYENPNPYNHPNAPYGTQNPYDHPIPPSSNMVWGILTTIFCCLPLGIVSIIYASKVDNLWRYGACDKARRAANNARNWAIASAVVALVLWIVYIVANLALFYAIFNGDIENYNY